MKKKIIGAIVVGLLATGGTVISSNMKDNKVLSNNIEEQSSVVQDNESNKENNEVVNKPNTEEKKDNNTENDKNKVETNKINSKEYIEKLNKIQEGIKDLNHLYSTGDITNMNAAAGDELKRWDDALNEIYGVLEKSLDKEVKSNMKKEQEQWIKSRDAKAKKESLEMEGTPSEALLYTQSLAQSTKLRCYELVEKYM